MSALALHKYPWRKLFWRTSCTSPRLFPSPVLVLTSHDIFTNLAFEDWLYEKYNRQGGCEDLLLLWRNDPCVVVGRHQNVWVEANIQRALSDGVKVARRRSGGGAVFHDRGNVNLTFVTDRKRYDRKRNLCLISAALNARWGLQVAVNSRDDLVINDKYKVSGTAAKLGGKIAYHHCTLLLNTNLSNVSKYLHGAQVGLSSKATASVRATVMNLCDVEPRVNHSQLVTGITEMFCASIDQPASWSYVDPSDETLFPGVCALREELENWDWIYGHSPKFTVQRVFNEHSNNHPITLSLVLHVEKGRVVSAEVSVECSLDWVCDLCQRLASSLNGARFWPSDLVEVVETVSSDSDESKVAWLNCLKEIMRRIVDGS